MDARLETLIAAGEARIAAEAAVAEAESAQRLEARRQRWFAMREAIAPLFPDELLPLLVFPYDENRDPADYTSRYDVDVAYVETLGQSVADAPVIARATVIYDPSSHTAKVSEIRSLCYEGVYDGEPQTWLKKEESGTSLEVALARGFAAYGEVQAAKATLAARKTPQVDQALADPPRQVSQDYLMRLLAMAEGDERTPYDHVIAAALVSIAQSLDLLARFGITTLPFEI